MKGYLILDMSITDLDGFMEYAEKIPAFIEKYGGRYVVKGIIPEPIEGDWFPERLAIVEFPSTEKAREFLSDPGTQELFSLRKNTTHSRLILAEGCL
ncbi:MAG: DUF1330 domain-containing protein [Gammaproteobacteria bacterium]|nr:DUF1330 domain-containing protein [Gammaproteobacteria bacterium]